MSRIRPHELEVGIRGQRIAITGYENAGGERKYASEETLDISLQQARDLFRLLGKLIPIAERSQPSAQIVSVSEKEAS